MSNVRHLQTAMRTPLSFFSLGAGALSVVAVAVAMHAETFRGIGSAVLLNTLDSWGLVRSPKPGAFAEAKPIGVLSLNDESALSLLLWGGVVSAVLACVVALVAEARREHNLYLAAGFICGAMALVVFNVGAGLLALAVGGIAISVLRRGRGA
jgi:hypothetical protein